MLGAIVARLASISTLGSANLASITDTYAVRYIAPRNSSGAILTSQTPPPAQTERDTCLRSAAMFCWLAHIVTCPLAHSAEADCFDVGAYLAPRACSPVPDDPWRLEVTLAKDPDLCTSGVPGSASEPVRRQRHARLVRRPLAWRRAAHRSSATSAAAFVSFGEALGLPVVHIAYPLPAGLGRWADPRVTGNMALTQGEHVRPILFDPCAD